ncbi:LPS O-antigen length regulator [Vibrio sp. T187]|uniref:GNVR domain-containing protein n=1 Tax=Vibrio TaxID=662 RepID=UPI0010C9C3B7|nr:MULTISPECIES: GNVR domain-containing protein [Vibrio]MBW3697576.1 LPS O-antigen length regulator [Vibrio sp. T187]
MNKSQVQEVHEPFGYTEQHLQVKSVKGMGIADVFYELWQGKWIIITITILFSIIGVHYALSQPNVYKAESVLTSSNDGGRSGMAAMAAQFGGLASLAGINIGGASVDSKTLPLAILNSRQFLNAFIDKHKLLVPLIAAKEWDKTSNTLLIQADLYDETNEKWVREVPSGRSVAPTDWEAYKAFKQVLSVSEAKDSGLVTISITHLSPNIAQQWVQWLVDDLNLWMKEKSLNETKRNIGYLEQQLEKTNISDMRSVFFQLIEEQTKNLMLAEVEAEFAFKTIDPAVIPEEKSGPKRALICVLAALLGGMLGVATVLMKHMFLKNQRLKISIE